MLFQSRPWPENTELIVSGQPVRVQVRVSARAKSYRLSLPHGRGPVLTVPVRGRWRDAQAFLHRHQGWLAERLEREIPPSRLAEGDMLPLRGLPHRIEGSGTIRGRVETTEREGVRVLLVPGEPEHRARRLIEWLKKEAKRDLEARVGEHAGRLGVRVSTITVRDQSGRWGSCSSAGKLSFNWRLVLAPPFVLDYVAAHEVAHRVEMNHSPAFWATVARTLPDMAEARAWLKTNGGALMGYGRAP